jgi:pSer/pThr/pTyr-binding forkhead associated (FHA) protein
VLVFAQLIPINGGDPLAITKDVTVVGRLREHCDISLERKSISKLHCVIVRTDGLLFVRDLSSTNGTRVNGQKILRGALLPGDILAFAGEKFRVQMGPGNSTSGAANPEQTEMLEIVPDSEVEAGAARRGPTRTPTEDLVE